MIKKFQQGGQADQAIMQFVQGLAQTLQADPQQVIQIAQQNPQALEAAIQTYQQTKDIKQAAQTFAQAVQQKTQAAKHGAKLNYIKSLKHQCAENEEVYYFKKGGSVGCGCKKKEDGGEIKKAEQGAVAKFKSTRKMQQAGKLPPYKKTTPDKNGEYTDNRGNIIISKKGIAEREAQLKNNKNEEGKADPNKKKESVKKQEDSKPKLQKKGGEVCPKCGKVHSAGVGCAVAKFKAHRQGGTLYFK